MTILFTIRCHDVTHDGLLHSDICGSILACNSPQLFAAYRVLLRLPMPRHPPCALISLTLLGLVSANFSFAFTRIMLSSTLESYFSNLFAKIAVSATSISFMKALENLNLPHCITFSSLFSFQGSIFRNSLLGLQR